jgi:sulfonate transport system substrate-binding protein
MTRFIIAVGLAILSATAGFAQQGTLRVGDQKGNSRAVMEAAGLLGDLPYTLEWKEFVAAAPLLEALNANAIDTGLVGDGPFTFAAAAGVSMKGIAAIRQNPGGLAVIVPKASPIQALADLKGKKIATTRGSIGHMLILAAMEHENIAPEAVQIVYMLPADAKVAYSRGSVDAWSTWEPYVSQEEVLFGARRVVTGEGITAGLSFQVARPEAIRDKRILLEDFISRLTAARAWSLANTDSYAVTWGKLMSVPASVATHWFERAHIETAPIDAGVYKDEQNTIDIYFRGGLIPKQISAKDLFDLSFADALTKGGGKIPQEKK